MDQVLLDTVLHGHQVFTLSLEVASLLNMDMINKLSSMAKDSATFVANNQGSTTLVSSSDMGALKAVSDKDNNSMQIDDIIQCWNNQLQPTYGQ